jgi:N-hydroxyarylamine O-acetyltransferase
VSSIPFENIDVQLGRPIRIDIESVFAKLVAGRRGGYCYEQNTLFCHVLRAQGFEVRTCEARVRLGSPAIRARTHAVLVVTAESQHWLCDVGFGSDGLMEPLPLDGRVTEQHPWRYRVAPEGPALVLQSERGGEWMDLYALSVAGCLPVDYEMANWFTSTFPESRFVQTLTAQRTLPRERRTLRNLSYSVTTGEGVTTRDIERADLLAVLRDGFDLDLPAGSRFRALDVPDPEPEPRG